MMKRSQQCTILQKYFQSLYTIESDVIRKDVIEQGITYKTSTF